MVQLNFAMSRLAIEWARASINCPQLKLPQAGSLLRIPRHYLDDTGVCLPTADQHTLLYTRNTVVDEWHAIQEWAVDLPARLWIIGGPGAGKSCAAFAFACSLDRATWDVMWMRYEPYQDQVTCVMFAGIEKWTFAFPAITAESTMCLLMAPWSLPSSKPLIVFLDGYHKTLADCETIRKMLVAWQIGDPRCRRLVCVTSMASRGKDHNESPMPVVAAENGRKVKVEKQFTLPSWTLDEYKEAVKDAVFFSSVRNKLQHTRIESADLDVQATATPATAPDPHTSPQELVEHKFYIAGGNARMMFHDTTSDAIAKLTAAVSTVDDFHRLRAGNIKDASFLGVNRLRGVYGKGSSLRCGIVSSLALRMLAAKTSPAKIMDLPSPVRVNPALDAFTLEAFVLASVTSGDLPFEVRTETATSRHAWTTTAVAFFDPDAHFSQLELGFHWNVPTKWDSCGYDAVVKEAVDANKREVRLVFLRTTQLEQHAFKAKSVCRELLQKVLLASPEERVVRVDLCFVVPSDALKDFEVPISQSDFKREVLEVVDATRGYDIECSVEVVGVRRPLYSQVTQPWLGPA